MYQSYALQEASSFSSYFLILVTVESVQPPFTPVHPKAPDCSMNQLDSIWGLVEATLHFNFWQLRQRLKHNTG